ncbi:MAG: YcxB family protein [Clostridia bacterium]|nr:YcxB family protein [Clostridia bacterium]
MSDQDKSICVTTEMNSQMQKELNAKQFILSLILIITGGAGVLVALILDVIATIQDKPDTEIFIVLIIFAVILGCGIGLLIIIRKTNKTVAAQAKVYAYEFFPAYFTITENCNGEEVAHAKIYNNQITKRRESKNYLFLYSSYVAAYPIDKRNLAKEELSELRNIFNIPQKAAKSGGAEK